MTAKNFINTDVCISNYRKGERTMKKTLCFILIILMLSSIFGMPVSALDYYVSHYEENIYAGGIVDLYAYPNVGNPEDYTYQWQYDAGFGGNSSWYDIAENSSYSGCKTNHLQIHTSIGTYDGWDSIPFRCVVTSSDGTVRKSNNITVEIYPTEKLIPNMKNWGYGMWDPNMTNVTDLTTSDEENYTASAFAGAKLQMWCGSKSIDDKPILRKSEVDIKTEIHITENGKTTVTGNNTSYIPYTVGNLKVEFKQKVTIGGYDLGYFDVNTVNITIAQPTTRMTAQTKSDCSLLRYTYNESQKLASIPKGTTLNIVGEDGSYYQVYYSGYVGYVGKSLVSSTTDATGKLISEVDVTVSKPVAGQNPSDTCTVETAACELYHIDPVTWTDESGKIVKSTDKFQEGKRYTVSIWLSAKSGYIFQTDAAGNPKLTGAINGDLPPYINKAYEQDPKQVIELRYTFAPTQKAPETTEPAHVHTPSDWRTTGVYHYKACTSCGEFLDQEDHRWSPTYLYQDATGHAWVCADCKVNSTIEAHNPGPAATETTPQTCLDCGYVITPENGHSHTPSEWRTTGIYHYTVCTTCGEFLDQEDHKGGIASCSAKGKCSVCGYEYIEENEDHTPDTSKWIARADMYHYHACKNCGAHCEIEDHRWSPTYLYQDAIGHAWICADCKVTSKIEVHNPGPAATQTTPQTCKDCGYIIEPAKNHQHDLTKVPQVPATCLEEGNIEYYTCSGCSDRFTDATGENLIPTGMSVAVGALGHSASDEWSYDEQHHWRICSLCNSVLEETRMNHEEEEGKCAICGYGFKSSETEKAPSATESATENTVTETTNATGSETETAATETTQDELDLTKPEKSGVGWGGAILICAATFGAAVTATVIVLKKRKD